MQREHQAEPKLPQPELTVANLLVARNQNESAETWFKNGIRADSATKQNLLEYARWLMQQDRLEFAGKMLSKTPAKWKSHRDVVFIKAVIDRCLGNLEAAESGLTSILRDSGSDLEASDQLALVLVESADQEKQDQAKKISANNLGRTPNLQRSVATAAWIELKHGSDEVAQRMFNALLKSGTISPQSAFYIGQYLESKDQEQEARAFYQRAVNSPGFFPQRRLLKLKLSAGDAAQ